MSASHVALTISIFSVMMKYFPSKCSNKNRMSFAKTRTSGRTMTLLEGKTVLNDLLVIKSLIQHEFLLLIKTRSLMRAHSRSVILFWHRVRVAFLWHCFHILTSHSNIWKRKFFLNERPVEFEENSAVFFFEISAENTHINHFHSKTSS